MEERLALLLFTWLGREGDLADGLPGLVGLAELKFPLIDVLLKLLTMLLTEPPPGRGPLAATRGPRVVDVLLVTEEWRDSEAFAGDALREEPDLGDVERLKPLGLCWEKAAGGEAGSGGGSLNDGRGSGGEAGGSGTDESGKFGTGSSGDSDRSGEGSLKFGRGGRSSSSGGGSLNVGGISAGLATGACTRGSGE